MNCTGKYGENMVFHLIVSNCDGIFRTKQGNSFDPHSEQTSLGQRRTRWGRKPWKHGVALHITPTEKEHCSSILLEKQLAKSLMICETILSMLFYADNGIICSDISNSPSQYNWLVGYPSFGLVECIDSCIRHMHSVTN